MPNCRASSIPLLSLLALVLSCSAPGRETQDKDRAFPAGAERAVRAVRDVYPDAIVSEVSPPQGFGAGTEDGSALFWVVSFRSQQTDQQLKVTPGGVIILLPRSVDDKDLPTAVADAVKRESSGAKVIRRERQEARATLRYAALAKPQVCYVAHLSKAGASKRIEVAADGKVLQSMNLESDVETEESTEPAVNPAVKEAEVPPAAARVVEAVRAILPKMVFRGVEEVGYLDGTGEMEVLNYEVEFFLDGVAREWNATPDGIVIQVPTPVGAETLPVPVQATLTKEADWKIQKLVRQETRAGLKFVQLEKPKVVYLVDLEKDGKPAKVRFRSDGTKIDEIDPMALLGKQH